LVSEATTMPTVAQEQLSLTPAAAIAEIVRRAQALAAAAPRRVVIGIAGGPGVGKSTIAVDAVAALNAAAPGLAAYVPMDGFHMKHKKLEALGTVADKGMPHTFEGTLFAEFLADLRSATGPVSGPGYSRDIEDTIEDAFTVGPEARVLVVEGNYLLLADSPWYAVKPLLDLSVFLHVGRDKVFARLLKRHAKALGGRFTEERNRAHIARVDLPNYDLVEGSAGRADLRIDILSEA
jgi:pantothenate kinase